MRGQERGRGEGGGITNKGVKYREQRRQEEHRLRKEVETLSSHLASERFVFLSRLVSGSSSQPTVLLEGPSLRLTSMWLSPFSTPRCDSFFVFYFSQRIKSFIFFFSATFYGTTFSLDIPEKNWSLFQKTDIMYSKYSSGVVLTLMSREKD